MSPSKSTHRPHGLGTVYQRPDGRWRAQATAGYTPSGNRRRLTVTRKTKSEAQSALKKLLRDAAAGDVPPAGGKAVTVRAWGEEWLPIQRHTLRPRTFDDYDNVLRRWILPVIGTRKLRELSGVDVRRTTDAVRRAGLSSTTARKVQAVLMKMVRDAVREGHTVPASALWAKRPRTAVNDRAAMPIDQALAVLKVASGDPDSSTWAAAFLQGLRQGERLGLTWDCVDLDGGTVDVSWQLQAIPYEHGCDDGSCGRKRAGSCSARKLAIPDGYEYRRLHGAQCLVRPKTASGHRVIPLVPWMSSALEAWREIAPASSHNLVWPRADGQPQVASKDLAAWHELQDRADVRHPAGRHWHGHEIRHTTATLLMSLGVDETVRVAILGHASIDVTRGYQHASLDAVREALEAAAGRLGLAG